MKRTISVILFIVLIFGISETKGRCQGSGGVLPIDAVFSGDGTISPFPAGPLFGLAMSGTVTLRGETSLVRVILSDRDGKEHLLYEAFPLTLSSNTATLENVCEETCALPGIVPAFLRVEAVDAVLNLESLTLGAAPGRAALSAEDRAAEKHRERIAAINEQIRKKGLRWVAGDTPISRLPYDQKRRHFRGGVVPNLQGFEYYKGGIFETSAPVPSRTPLEASPFPARFDWRERHGANLPGSPYYDGDPAGSGWMTSIKNQGLLCGGCWAFSSLAALEGLVNLYFNGHLDLDLSEQEIIDCTSAPYDPVSHCNGCSGGNDYACALPYFKSKGVVDEACLPYQQMQGMCNAFCPEPAERIRITDFLTTPPQPPEAETARQLLSDRAPLSPPEAEAVKQLLIDRGPLSTWINLEHLMALVGFDTDRIDGRPIWIFKNSWGVAWGENGYGYVRDAEKIAIILVSAIVTPLESLATPRQIVCADLDGDGYCNWGISETRPGSCPAACRPEKDCDDSDPGLGPADGNGNCLRIGGASARLTVAKGGDGAGTIRSEPFGLYCGSRCSHEFLAGAAVTLTATPAAGSVFAGWSGACAGTGPCRFTLSGEQTATALFRPTPAGWGSVWTWGIPEDDADQSGSGADPSTIPRPQKAGDLTHVIAVAAGRSHTVALKDDGTLWQWGMITHYDYSVYPPTPLLEIRSAVPVRVEGLADVRAVAAGDSHTVAVKDDGSVWAWGMNDSGQLGNNTLVDSAVPVRVEGLANVRAVAAGGGYTIALKDDGSAWAWGRNGSGQLGNNTLEDSAVPVRVEGLADVRAVAAGGSHTVALKNDGSVWAWGNNYSGQLGDNTKTNSPVPVLVAGLADIRAVAAGSSHTVALKDDGTVWAWGNGRSGALGNNAKTDSPIPVQAVGLADVRAVAAGTFYTLAAKQDGTVWEWGLIDASNFNRTSVPTAVAGLPPVGAVAAGTFHSVAAADFQACAALPGDIDGAGGIALADAILILQILAGQTPAGIRTDCAALWADLNGDGKLDLTEAIYILQKTAETR